MNDRVSSPEDLEAVEKSAKNDSKAAETQAAQAAQAATATTRRNGGGGGKRKGGNQPRGSNASDHKCFIQYKL